jgi:hypothetical protein
MMLSSGILWDGTQNILHSKHGLSYMVYLQYPGITFRAPESTEVNSFSFSLSVLCVYVCIYLSLSFSWNIK